MITKILTGFRDLYYKNKNIIFVLVILIQHYGNNINVLWHYYFNVLFG
jgi:hypothetical protein